MKINQDTFSTEKFTVRQILTNITEVPNPQFDQAIEVGLKSIILDLLDGPVIFLVTRAQILK